MRVSIFVLLFWLSTFSQIKIISQKDGEITLKIEVSKLSIKTVDNKSYISGIGNSTAINSNGIKIPTFKFKLFAQDKNSIKVEISSQGEITVPLSNNLTKEDTKGTLTGIVSPITQESYRDVDLYTFKVSPIKTIGTNNVTQYKEIFVTIHYKPVLTPEIPKGDYYKTIAHSALNPNEFNRVYNRSKLRGLSSSEYIKPNETMIRFDLYNKAGDFSEFNSDNDGLYKITPQMLADLGIANQKISSIALFSSNNSVRSDTTPSGDAIPSALVDVPLIIKDENNDGVFNDSDKIFFWGEATSFWKYSNGYWNFKLNPFSSHRYYYLRFNSIGKTMPAADLPSGTGVVKSSAIVLDKVNISKQLIYDQEGYGIGSKDWVWTTFTPQNNLFNPPSPLEIYNKDSQKSAQIRFPTNGGVKIPSFSTSSIAWNNSKDTTKINGSSIANRWFDIPQDVNNFTLTISNMGNSNYWDFMGYEVKYYRNLDMSGVNYVKFYSDERYDRLNTYSITGLNVNSNYILLRMQSDQQSVALIDTISNSSSYTFNDSSKSGYSFYIIDESSALTPHFETISAQTKVINSSYQVRDLHNSAHSSDYMIITPPEFVNQAIEFADLKVKTSHIKKPTVVTTEDIYREFSGGILDPSAIRNFMVYVKSYWKEGSNGSAVPDYMLLMGIGNYDYKGILGKSSNFVPVYINSRNKNVEDFYTYLNEGETPSSSRSKPSLSVGRIPAFNSSEIDNYLSKLKYMVGSDADFSEWRNRILLVADDDRQGNGPDGIPHWEQSDEVGDVILDSMPTVHTEKITLFEYQRTGNFKPGAKTALIDAINSGTSLVNYFGHGSHSAMADEYIFTLPDIASLYNKDKYMIYAAFSCSVGFFDIPNTPSLAGAFVTAANKGSIASIASTRTAYSNSNKSFALAFYKRFFSSNAPTIGMAYIGAKSDENLIQYALLGDPSYRPLSDNKNIDIALENSNGVKKDTLKALQRVALVGTVPSDRKIDSISIQIENPEQLDNKRKDGIPDEVHYKLPGKILLNQTVALTSNTIKVPLTIPLPVVIDSVGTKLRVYGWCDGKPQSITGLDSLFFTGIDVSNIDTTDKSGPNIVIRLAQDSTKSDTTIASSLDDRVVIDGFMQKPEDINPTPAQVELFFSDSSGIDIFGDQPGEGVTISIKGVRTAKNYNGDFKSIDGSPNKGKVTLFLNQDEFPKPGEYELTVSTSDFLKNRTSKKFTIEVKSTRNGVYDIGDFYAYPSPVHMGEETRFYFNAPNDAVHRITLKIFTLSGRLVRQFNDVKAGVRWDLRDQIGNPLSPSIYLYRLYVERDKRRDENSFSNTTETEIIKSPIRKMAIYPPK